jgi:hypothetical protein
MMQDDIELIPVEGHQSLGRDPGSNAIVNTDNNAYDAYIKARNQSKRKDKELESLKAEIDELKNLVGKLVQQQDK